MSDKESTARIKIKRLPVLAGRRSLAEGGVPANSRLEPCITTKTAHFDGPSDDRRRPSNGFPLLELKDKKLLVGEAQALLNANGEPITRIAKTARATLARPASGAEYSVTKANA